jgi:hypothetical protein
MNEIELAYVGIDVPDPGTLDGFFRDVIGLMPGDDPYTWRNDRKTHRVIVRPGERNDAAFIGFEATDVAAFDRTVARLGAAGFDPADGDAEERKVQRLARTTAPWGVPVEIVLGLEDAPAHFSSTLVPFGPDAMHLYDDRPAFADFAAGVTTGTLPVVDAELRCPVPAPRQVFAIGLNYRSHAEESGMAVPREGAGHPDV